MKIETRTLPIKDLILWDENARFPDKYYNSNEKELINYFISKPVYKIKKLITEVVKDFELPQIEKLVVWNDEGNYVVLEGNRRLTAYKLLINPELAVNSNMSAFLKEQKEIISIDENFKLECLVTNDKTQGFRYIDRKHANGNNEVNWNEPERVNYNLRRDNKTQNNSLKLAITNIVRELDLPNEMKEKVLGRGFVTNFFRIITTTPAKRKYGYKILEDGQLEIQYKNFKDELKIIIYNLLNKKDFEGNKIDSRTLNKKENIEEFIQGIKPNDIKKVEKAIVSKTSENLFGDKSLNLGNNKLEINKTNHKNKQTPKGLFFSKDVPFYLNSSSLKILYDELKNISVKDFPNATHDLLRSFLECSLVFFFKEINEFDSIKKSNAHNPKLGELLTHIINGNCEKITDVNLIATLKQIKTDYDQPYSLERMNMINHNENFTSKEKDVRASWAQLESLFKVILIPN
jgi:hypothetical protein